MESKDVAAALHEADRAAASPYIDYPETPRWYPPATGVWAAAFCLAVGIPGHHVLRAVTIALLAVVEGVFLGWYRRYRGTMPGGRAPREIQHAMAWFAVGFVLVVAVVGLVLWLVSGWVAAIVALVVVTPAVARYERVYAVAAARARARLA